MMKFSSLAALKIQVQPMMKICVQNNVFIWVPDQNDLLEFIFKEIGPSSDMW